MDYKSAILELYDEGIPQAEKIRPETEEYKAAVKKMEQVRKELEQKLPESKVELLNQFENAYNQYTGCELAESFRHGMCLGIRITAEAFLFKKE